MASSYIYKDGNVTFTKVIQPQIYTGQKITSGDYIVNEDDEIERVTTVLNAIDIDWNSAIVEGLSFKTINSSSDLLNLIKEIHDKIPRSITDLVGGTDVLTIENLEILKEEFRGKSAYEIAKEVAEKNGQQFTYTEEQWVASLKGERGLTGNDGKNGLSAFEIAQTVYQTLEKDFPYQNEYEWMQAIIGGDDLEEKLAKKQNVLVPGEGIVINGNVISSPLATWIDIS